MPLLQYSADLYPPLGVAVPPMHVDDSGFGKIANEGIINL
jgi:hypothetical protein